MKRLRLLIPIALLVALLGVLWLRGRHRNTVAAYVGERNATLWSSLAQVRQPVATLHYGDKVAVVQRRAENVNVRTAQGVSGWMDARLLMEPALWQRSEQLLAQARVLPVQARGHTKVVSNLRIEPGRSAARIYQFGRGAAVETVSRAVAESSPGEEGATRESGETEQKSRREDWFLVRGRASGPAMSAETGLTAAEQEGNLARTDEAVERAGWVLARFIELDLPGPIRDYASSSGLRVVAWFELNRVREPSGEEKPQYLAAGSRGGEGQPCDFTMIRVYTWGGKRQRYETAYVESNLCGRLPIRVGRDSKGDPEFRFATMNEVKPERHYVMHQTVVRRIREAERVTPKRGSKAR